MTTWDDSSDDGLRQEAGGFLTVFGDDGSENSSAYMHQDSSGLYFPQQPDNLFNTAVHGDNDLDLLELALRLRWSSVAARASRFPTEIGQQDCDGLTVLHWACCNPPPVAVWRLLTTTTITTTEATKTNALSSSEGRSQSEREEVKLCALKTACQALDKNGMTPLLCACALMHPLTVEMIQAILQLCPESLTMTDHDGWTALHYVCCRASSSLSSAAANGFRPLPLASEKARLLLDRDGTLALQQDASGKTALALLTSMFEVELQSAYLFGGNFATLCPSASMLPTLLDSTPSSNSQTLVGELWALVCLIVESASVACGGSQGVISNAPNHSILHKLVMFPNVPLELIMFCCVKHPHLLTQQDAHGNTPLHLAASRTALRKEAPRREQDLQVSLTVGSFLARQGPAAACMVNERGESPLHLANDHFETYNSLFESLLLAPAGAAAASASVASPSSTHDDSCLSDVSATTNPMEFLKVDALYPAVMARISENATAIYGMLLARPGLVRVVHRPQATPLAPAITSS